MKKAAKIYKKINNASIDSQSELNAMIENVPMAVFLVDRERKVRRANVAAAKFVGTKNKNIEGLRAGAALRCLNSFCSPKGCGFSPVCKDCLIRNTVDKTFEEKKGFGKVEAKIEVKDKEETKKLDLLISTSLVNISNEQLSLIYVEDVTERKQMEKSLRETKDYLEKLINHANAPIIVWNPSYEIIRINYAFEQLTGYSAYELMGKKLSFLFPQKSKKESMEKIINNAEGKNKQAIEIPIKHKNRNTYKLLWSSANIYDDYYDKARKKLVATIAQGQDITELKKKEEEIIKLSRILKAKGSANKAITLSKDEKEYLNEICRVVIEDCGYAMTWIGFSENDEEKTVKPIASAGFERGYVKKLKVSWSKDNPRGRGPTGTAIRTGRISICKNMLHDPLFKPWRSEAIKRGYASSIVFPLKANNKILGAITIYSRETNPFFESEIRTLKELSHDISYGITYFRLKNANKKAEEKIQQLASFPRLNPNPVIEIDAFGKITFLNKAAEKHMQEIGLEHKINEFVPKDIKTILKDLRKKKSKHFYREIKIGDKFFSETIHLTAQYNVVRIYAVNITRRKLAEEFAIYSSTHDALTGIHNRYFFENQLEKFRRKRNFNGGVMMIDVNNLKKTNDQFGHSAGDRIIQETANFLVREIRKKDLLVRYGGDEFCIILPDIEPDKMDIMAERMRNKIRNVVIEDMKDVQLSISIGAVHAPRGRDLDKAIKIADEKMYAEKFLGRNKLFKSEKQLILPINGIRNL
jgi:diguanylate cyclase (GGDEF)-like protein/PAS domain S-box-containing protein